MSDIIPFPKLKQKLEQDLKQAFDAQHYDLVYDLFLEYEKSFELTNHLAICKCETLWELESYLELKEEANILLSIGYQPYDTFMTYYVKSLFQLKHYHEVVQVIDQVIDEVKQHQTRLVLLPIRDEAQVQLNHRREVFQKRLQEFTSLSFGQQTELILDLMDDGAYHYTETLAYYVTNESLDYRLMTLILEYLTIARYNQSIRIHKFDKRIDVVPFHLQGASESEFKQKLVPEIIEVLEMEMPSFVIEAHQLLNSHNLALYPINIEDMYTLDQWRDAYLIFFKQLLGQSSQSDDEIDSILDFINLLNT